jgi:hypothetical protein
MPVLNYKARVISCKVVYFGPSLGGKTTSIRAIHQAAPETSRSSLQTIQTEGDRTLFFDYFSLDLAEVGGMRVRFQVYGVPGEPFYRATRKMVLVGSDGIIFVADSAEHRLADNVASYNDLKEMLKEHGYIYDSLPLIMQYNKRDLVEKCTVDQLDFYLNERKVPHYESTAIEGKGVREPFKAICRAVIEKLNQDLAGYNTPPESRAPAPASSAEDDPTY